MTQLYLRGCTQSNWQIMIGHFRLINMVLLHDLTHSWWQMKHGHVRLMTLFVVLDLTQSGWQIKLRHAKPTDLGLCPWADTKWHTDQEKGLTMVSSQRQPVIILNHAAVQTANLTAAEDWVCTIPSSCKREQI